MINEKYIQALILGGVIGFAIVIDDFIGPKPGHKIMQKHIKVKDAKNFNWKEYGHDIENFQGTLGPRDITPEGVKATAERMAARTGGPAGLAGGGPVNGLYLKVVPRKPRASL